MKTFRTPAFLKGVATSALFVVSTSLAAVPERKMVVIDSGRPDFTVQSIFSEKAQSLLLTELRGVLASEAGVDPLERHFEKPISLKFPIRNKMGAAIKEMVEEIINMRFESSEVMIEIEGLRVKSPHATLRFGAAQPRANGLDFTAMIRLKETVASVDRIVIRFKSNQNTRTFLDRFYVELKDMSLRAETLDSLAADISVRTDPQPDGSIKIGLDSGVLRTFDDVDPEKLAKELILIPGSIKLPEGFGLQIGRAVMPGDSRGLEEIVERRKVQIARMLMNPLAKELRAAPAKIFKKGTPSFTVPASVEMELPCLGKTGIRIMRYGVLGANQMQVALGLSHPTYPRSSHGFEHFDSATNAVYEKIDQDKASIVLGVGYRALAWGLKYGLDHCLADKIPKALQVGPQGVEVRLDEPGNGLGVFALHAQSKLKWLLRVVLGKKIIEFPVKISPSLDYIPRTASSDPKLKLDLSDADLSKEVLLSGYKSIPSNVEQLRLKKLVLKKVREQLQTGLGKAQLEIPLPFAKGEDLDFADIESDGFGNLNLNLSLDPKIHSEARGFWNLLSDYLKPMIAKVREKNAAKSAPSPRAP